jgi:hypothetical protein
MGDGRVVSFGLARFRATVSFDRVWSGWSLSAGSCVCVCLTEEREMACFDQDSGARVFIGPLPESGVFGEG